PQIQFSVWSPEEKAAVGLEPPFRVFSLVATDVATGRLHVNRHEAGSFANKPNRHLTGLGGVGTVRRRGYADSVTELPDRLFRRRADCNDDSHRLQHGWWQGADVDGNQDQPAHFVRKGARGRVPGGRQQVMRFVEDDPMRTPCPSAQLLQLRK